MSKTMEIVNRLVLLTSLDKERMENHPHVLQAAIPYEGTGQQSSEGVSDER